jgi:hypothetical protein
MPDDSRTPDRTRAEEAVLVTKATMREGVGLVAHEMKAAERGAVQPLGPLHQFVEETMRVTQDVTNHATQNLDTLIRLATAAADGWQQAIGELTQRHQQAVERQTQVLNEALMVRQPDELLAVHSRFLTEFVQLQLGTYARLAQIGATISQQAAQRLEA